MTRRRISRQPARFGSAFLLLSAVVPAAAAQDIDCATLQAMANADGDDLAQLRLEIVPRSGVAIRAREGRSGLPAASACDVDSDDENVDLSCRWQFGDYATATAFFDPLLERMRHCLRRDFPAEEIATRTPGWLVMRLHGADLATADSETRIELTLVESSHQGEAQLPGWLHYYVGLSTAWSGEAPDPIDEPDLNEP